MPKIPYLRPKIADFLGQNQTGLKLHEKIIFGLSKIRPKAKKNRAGPKFLLKSRKNSDQAHLNNFMINFIKNKKYIVNFEKLKMFN